MNGMELMITSMLQKLGIDKKMFEFVGNMQDHAQKMHDMILEIREGQAEILSQLIALRDYVTRVHDSSAVPAGMNGDEILAASEELVRETSLKLALNPSIVSKEAEDAQRIREFTEKAA